MELRKCCVWGVGECRMCDWWCVIGEMKRSLCVWESETGWEVIHHWERRRGQPSQSHWSTCGTLMSIGFQFISFLPPSLLSSVQFTSAEVLRRGNVSFQSVHIHVLFPVLGMNFGFVQVPLHCNEPDQSNEVTSAGVTHSLRSSMKPQQMPGLW